MTAVTFDGIRKLGRAVAYYPNLAKPLGGATSAILFSQLLYWHERAETQLGTYKTIEEIEAETGLTRREQETACKNLEKLGILTKTHKRLQHRMYYKLNPEAFDKAMADFETGYTAIGETAEATFPNVQNRHSGEHETAIRETAKPPLDECTKPPSVIGTLDYHKITNTRLLTEINSGVAAIPQPGNSGSLKTLPAETAKPAKPKKTDTQASDLAALVNLGVEEQLAKDWLQTRKEKRAGSLTQTVVAGLQREAAKAGLTVPQAVQVAAERGWARFNASYLRNEAMPFASSQKPKNNTVPKHENGGFQEWN